MANVLCIYENKISTVSLTENFFEETANYDNNFNYRFVSILKLKKSDLEYCDVLYMIRPNNHVFGRIAKIAKKSGITVVYYIDDDLLHLPLGIVDIPWRKKGASIAAKESDIIVSSSQYICDSYRKKFNISRSVTIDTAVPSKDIKPHLNEKNDRIKIVYAAGIAHKELFDKYIKPVLKDIDIYCGKKISLTFMGVHPELNEADYSFPIIYIDSLPLSEYRKRIEQENFDIGLAPLVTNDFTKCKYYNKFIEYAMFGIVGLYSDTEPYTFVVNDKENGILVGNSPKNWLNAICSVVNNEELVKKCRNNIYNTLKERFDQTIITNSLFQNIPELIGIHKDKRLSGILLSFAKTQYRFSRFADWIYKFGFYYKKEGFKGVISGIKRKLHSYRVG